MSIILSYDCFMTCAIIFFVFWNDFIFFMKSIIIRAKIATVLSDIAER